MHRTNPASLRRRGSFPTARPCAELNALRFAHRQIPVSKHPPFSGTDAPLAVVGACRKALRSQSSIVVNLWEAPQVHDGPSPAPIQKPPVLAQYT
ncbi:hypothetical protein GCM10010260_59680 [Streptomyces filipinensis]|uniref:Uncharacterized protein n=1 Tax=Streptomyces filipinensis TaxID=66887 RepID=A0A918IG18_9ACTN|nr:hypothetical protein GCM10010260_59680 [Streptomyces filipinensis]